ncbi:TPA: phage tail protein [Salmonella enterica subsp. enterica serovar Orientalis]|nr:phage tail protein [Salmonella enterica subsp. enterica serovar Orientalis]
MPQTTVTSSFNRYKAQEAAGGRRVILDEFVFANIPGLDASQLPTDTEGLPDEKYIVYRQSVDRGGMVNADTVVYTVTLPTTAGNFTFNWMALINRESGAPAVITYLYPQQKIKNADGVQGNVLTYSEYMRYTGASTLTGITTPASTWQIDFTARLHGMDEATRKVALDLYGNSLFFGDGFKLMATDTPGLAELAPGTAYLRGLRTELTDSATLTFETGKEQTISIDTALTGALTGENRTTFTLISHETADYTDALGFRHYVEPIARIAPDGTITDLRTVGHKVRDVLAGEFLEKSKNLSEIAAAGEEAQKEAREHLALGKLATLDSVSTDDGTAMKKAANGSDIENVALFRNSLQLGDSATRNVGKLAGTVAAGDDSRITGAMQKDQNGADIPDKPLFVRTLGIADSYPAGCPIPYPGLTAPNGYLLMDGRTFSRTLYPQLAKLYADGILPDLRGMHIRGWDNGRGIDIPRKPDGSPPTSGISARGFTCSSTGEGKRALLGSQYYDGVFSATLPPSTNMYYADLPSPGPFTSETKAIWHDPTVVTSILATQPEPPPRTGYYTTTRLLGSGNDAKNYWAYYPDNSYEGQIIQNNAYDPYTSKTSITNPPYYMAGVPNVAFNYITKAA